MGRYATMPGRLRRKTVHLEPDVEAELRQVALRLGRSEAEVARQAIREYLDRFREGER